MITTRVVVKCINKRKFKNKIISYELQDKNFNTFLMTPDELKSAIKNNQIYCINLKLTSDNRLITIKEKRNSSTVILQYNDIQAVKELLENSNLKFKINMSPNNIKVKAELLGGTFRKIKEHLYLIKTNNDAVIFTDCNKLYCGNTLKVNKFDSYGLFEKCTLNSITFENLDTSKTLDMSFMFYGCKINSINFKDINTSNVIDMSAMFKESKIKILDLSNFDTSRVYNMANMFDMCITESINMTSFNTSNVTDMHAMFCDCTVKLLDISGFNTSNVIYMSNMFRRCKSKKLDLTSFDTHRVTTMDGMFNECEAEILDMKSFNTCRVNTTMFMLHNCKAKYINLSSFKLIDTCCEELINTLGDCKATIKLNKNSSELIKLAKLKDVNFIIN